MKHFYLIFAALCSATMLMAAPQPNIKYVIWSGENQTDAAFWANTGDNAEEAVAVVDVPAALENGLYNATAMCLSMQRTTADTWHGIGFNVEPLQQRPTDANHFYLLVKKTAAGPVKLEMQIDNGEGGIVQAWASADYHTPGQWQALLFPMWEDSVFNANPEQVIKTIYLHTHDADASQGEPVGIWLDEFTAGYDMWNMPADIHCYSGWNDINGYNNIRTLNVWNDAEVGGADKEVSTLRYVRTHLANEWTTIGLPNCLNQPNEVIASFSEVYDAIDTTAEITWKNTHGDSILYAQPYMGRSTDDSLVMNWTNAVINYNPEVTIADGWQLVSNPVMQLFNAGFFAIDSTHTHVYLPAGDRFEKIDNAEHLIPAMTAFLVYRGENAPAYVACSNGGTGLMDMPIDGVNQPTLFMQNGQVFIRHNGRKYTVLGNYMY